MSEQAGFGIDIQSCSGDADTCPVVQRIFDQDEFCVVMSDIELSAMAMHNLLGDFVTACAQGTCPGQNIEQTRQALRSLVEQPQKDEDR